MNWFTAHLSRLRAGGKLEARAPALRSDLTGSERLLVLLSSLVVGLFPIAPATVASAATAGVVYLLRGYGSPLVWLVAAAAVFVLGVPVGTAAEIRLQTHDPRWFILDEVSGQLLFFVFFTPTVLSCCAGFVLFRAFDVLKLPPADRLEHLPGGWGIMVDDVVAGLYACVPWYLVTLLWR